MRAVRIAYLVEEFPVLSQTFILNQIRGLLARGHELEIFAEWREPSEDWVPEPLRSELRNAMRCSPPIPRSRAMRALGAIRIFARASREERDVLLRTINVSRFGSQAASLRLLYLAARLVRTPKRFDIVRACFGQNGVRALFLRESGALLGPIATSFHGYDVSEDVGEARAHYPRLFAAGEVMLPTGDSLSGDLIRLGCPSERIRVLPSAIDCELFVPPQRRPPDRPLRVVSVGRLVEKKGFAFGIEAVARAAAAGVELHYTIVGDGPLRSRLEEAARSLGVGARVSFAGALTPRGVRDQLQLAHILLAPSVTTPEGDRDARVNVIKEAFACELPVIATRHGGIPELVTDGENGILVAERDAAAIAAVIVRLDAGRSELAAMGRSSRARVVGAYDIGTTTTQLEGLLSATISTRENGISP